MEIPEKRGVRYVDNEQMYDILLEYTEEKKRCIEAGLPIPVIPDEIGISITNMAHGFASRYNFRDYFFKDDMIGDAIVDALAAVNGYKPEKTVGKNAFGFFNQTIFWSFLRRIKAEKKEQAMRESLMFDGDDAFTSEHGDTHQISKDEWYIMYNNE